jgi:hypothetical protein
MIRDLKPQKPVIGQTMRDLAGNKYEVLSVGLKYANCRQVETGGVGLIPFQSLLPMLEDTTPGQPTQEEFE